MASVSGRTGISVHTVRRWRGGRVPAAVQTLQAGGALCERCGADAHEWSTLDPHVYAYVLGLYLGDGCLSGMGGTVAFRLACDAAYPGILAEACEAIAALYGRTPHVYDVPGKQMWSVTAYWRSWPCLFPQHGPGKKQDRPIVLEPWQQELVEAAPGRFLRGLIHTDGWRGTNKVTVNGKAYAYPRYQFSSRSDDIRRLFTDTCDLLGIVWRPWGRWHVSVARRDAVAALDEHVGLKH